jgi:hypothetical protein
MIALLKKPDSGPVKEKKDRTCLPDQNRLTSTFSRNQGVQKS